MKILENELNAPGKKELGNGKFALSLIAGGLAAASLGDNFSKVLGIAYVAGGVTTLLAGCSKEQMYSDIKELKSIAVEGYNYARKLLKK